MDAADRHARNKELTLVELSTFLGDGTLGGHRFGHFREWMLSDAGREFKRFDKNRNGTISMAELQRAVQVFLNDDALAAPTSPAPVETRQLGHSASATQIPGRLAAGEEKKTQKKGQVTE